MRTRLVMLAGAIAAALVLAAPASAASWSTPVAPEPAWLTDALKAQISEAGADGVQVSEEYLNTECPGVASPGVSANGCIVSPSGCTANFIYQDAAGYLVGTAAHCTENVGGPVIMQVDTTTLAEVGTVSFRTAEEEPGEDFALIRIYPEVASKWGINPALPVVGGPQGIYTGCDPTGVKTYGHGYGVAVGQGKPQGGLATVWYDDGYGWNGTALPGDSGSGVVTESGLAAGNLTHLIIYDPAYTPANVAGTRVTEILRRTGVALVNQDFSTTTYNGDTGCGTDGDDGGGSGGNGGGNGGGKPDKGGGSGKGGGKKTA